MKTFKEAIAHKGIDEQHQIHLLRRRARHSERQDRFKVFSDVFVSPLRYRRPYGADQAARDLAILRNPGNTAEYVAAWCRLNELKE